MPASGYVADTFVAGEQPTTSKFNELWGNDASFNNGNGFNDGILIARHFAAASVGTAALNLSAASFTNTGTFGGSFYSVTIGSLKMIWGQTNTFAIGGSNTATGTVIPPASFFTTIQNVQAMQMPNGNQNILGQTITNTSIGITVQNEQAGAVTDQLYVWVIGA